MDSFCKCGCGNKITEKPYHKKYGIPNFISGHNVRGGNHPMLGVHRFGKKSPNWKGGFWEDKNYKNLKLKEWRHEKGISKQKREELIRKTPEEILLNKKCCQKKWKQSLSGRISQKKHNVIHRTRTRDLSIATIQLVYEDNIKRFGTLTCYLCLEPIAFKKDNLEHRIPLSRGGTNEYKNLAVSCQKCNCKKHNKTEKEYRKEQICAR